MNYTKGPWKLMKSHTGQTWFIVFKTLETRQRSEIVKVYKGPSLVKNNEEEATALGSIDPLILNNEQNKVTNEAEALANANLIAASPELYEFAKIAMKSFMGDKTQSLTDLVIMCQHAIDKAEGGGK